jgi:hypothetical protein
MASEICQDRLVRHMKTDEWVSLGTQDTSQRGGEPYGFRHRREGSKQFTLCPNTPKCRPNNAKLPRKKIPEQICQILT